MIVDVRARLLAVTLPDDVEHLSTSALARLLGINWATVHRAAWRGELPMPMPRTAQFKVSDLRKFQRRQVAP